MLLKGSAWGLLTASSEQGIADTQGHAVAGLLVFTTIPLTVQGHGGICDLTPRAIETAKLCFEQVWCALLSVQPLYVWSTAVASSESSRCCMMRKGTT